MFFKSGSGSSGKGWKNNKREELPSFVYSNVEVLCKLASQESQIYNKLHQLFLTIMFINIF